MTLGQLAYEQDLVRRPTYHDGARRPAWHQLSDIARSSWERTTESDSRDSLQTASNSNDH